jgi:hypothetical protein
MTDADLHTPVGAGTSFAWQLRLLGWSGRWVYLVAALLLVLVAAKTLHADAVLGVPLVGVAAMVGLPAPVLWGLVVWQGELPHRRSYHWSLPVARPGHDLARVAAGAVWLLAAYLVLAGIGAILAATSGEWARFAAIGPAWITFFAAPLVLYLLVAPLALWSDSRWLLRVMVGWIVLGVCEAILQLESYRRVAEAVFGYGNGWGLATVLFGGFLRHEADGPSAASVVALWLGIGLVATVGAAVWRPADLARLLRRR